MLRLARTAALVCCDREIGGMAKRQLRAVTVGWTLRPLFRWCGARFCRYEPEADPIEMP